MDMFIDKLTQKFSAQDVIKANMAAEAKENKKLREKVENYESLLQEMKEVNAKNMESAEKINQLAQTGCDNILKTVEEVKETPLGDKEYIENLFAKADDSLHKENIKVYRNVQAVVVDGLKEQTENLLQAQQENAKKQGKFLKAMSVLIFVAVLADITLNVLRIFGVF